MDKEILVYPARFGLECKIQILGFLLAWQQVNPCQGMLPAYPTCGSELDSNPSQQACEPTYEIQTR